MKTVREILDLGIFFKSVAKNTQISLNSDKKNGNVHEDCS